MSEPTLKSENNFAFKQNYTYLKTVRWFYNGLAELRQAKFSFADTEAGAKSFNKLIFYLTSQTLP